MPIAILLYNIEPVLLLLYQDEKVAKYTEEYVMTFLPGLFILAHIDLHRRFLNSLGKNYVPMLCLTVGVFLHIILSYIFVIRYQMEIVGTGIALVITNLIIFSG